MKRGKQSVPAAETGAIPGDFTGSRRMFMPTKGGQNASTNEARRGAGGMAPKPSGGAAMLGNDRPSHPVQAGLGRVKGAGSSPTGKMPTAGSFTPVQNNAMANLVGQSTGQAEVNPRGSSARVSPQTRMPATSNPVATNKPKRKGLGSAFFGEY